MKNSVSGTVSLNNSKSYPFNDSEKTIPIIPSQLDCNYIVLTEVISTDGEVGDISVADKAINGFKLSYSGSAKEVTLRYYILGG